MLCNKASKTPTPTSSGSERRPGSPAMGRSSKSETTEAIRSAAKKRDFKGVERALLKKCHLNEKSKKRLFKLLNSLIDKAGDAKDLVQKFGDKCYADENSSEQRFEEADLFVKNAFGKKENLFAHGPEKAFNSIINNMIKSLYRPDASRRISSFECTYKHFSIGHVLGVGATAEVRMGEDLRNGRKVAIKVYKPKHASTAAAEAHILTQLNHPNIIKVLACYENVNLYKYPLLSESFRGKGGEFTTVIVMELANMGELIKFIMYTDRFEPPLVRWCFDGLLGALKACHAQNIVHRDLKPDNCLIHADSKTKEVKILVNDFGFSKTLSRQDGIMHEVVGTMQYAAPEILRTQPYTKSVDIFSLGVMLFITMTKLIPFKKADKTDRWFRFIMTKNWKRFWKLHMKPKGSYQFTAEEKQLLEGMMAHDPMDRWELEQVLQHPWFSGPKPSKTEVRGMLHKRKIQMDERQSKGPGHGKNAKDKGNRAIPWTDKDVEAPMFHTDFPSIGRLWFYSNDPPSGIIKWLNKILKMHLYAETDCDEVIEEYKLDKEDYKKNEYLEEMGKKDGMKDRWTMAEAVGKRTSDESTAKTSSGSLKEEEEPTAAPAESAETTTTGSGLPGAVGLGVPLASKPSPAEDETKEEAPPLNPDEGFVPLLAGSVNPYALEKCEDRMKHGVFQLNFTVRADNVRQSGMVEVFSCPSDQKISIVMFCSTKAKDDDSTSNPMLLSMIYDMILKNGGYCLLAQAFRTQEHLSKRNRAPKLDYPELDEDDEGDH